MDEDLAIINTNTRNEKIKNFFIRNKKKFLILILAIISSLLFFFALKEFQNKQKINISNLYNTTIIEYEEGTKNKSRDIFINIINKKDSTYSPLSLYFIIDNALVTNQTKINELFDIIIEEVSLEKEIKNLIIYKKALYNADNSNEIQLLDILSPIINSKSVWESHGLYLMAEYFYSKGEKQKSKEFFNKIISLEEANRTLKIESQKRLNRDF